MSKAATLSSDDQLKILNGQVIALQQDVRWMRKLGGFTDSKDLSVRSKRLEDRLERVERDLSMVVEMIQLVTTFVTTHVRDRHEVSIIAPGHNSPEVLAVRKINRVLAEWVLACQQPKKPTPVLQD